VDDGDWYDSASMNADEIKHFLNLQPHPEGGWFAQTYKSREVIAAEALPSRYGGSRSFGTCIYYLLEPGTFSELHRLRSDEIFHFYMGDPVEMLQLWPEGRVKTITIGSDLSRGMVPQVVVPREVWQGSRLVAGGKVALMGCTVAPGFEFEDYERASREDLKKAYPKYAEMIEALTRD
jgi:uncharacterized protein